MGFYSTTDFRPEVSLGYLARRVQQLAQTGLEPVCAAAGLSYLQWHALVSIHYGRGTTCAALARDLAYDKGATTRLVDVLEDKGWVRRARDGDDRRIVGLTLTAEGERLARDVRDDVIEAWNGWVEDWPAADLAAAIATLQRLHATLEDKIA